MSKDKKVLPEVKIQESPTVGRIVHFVDMDGMMHRAAVITHVWNAQTVNLYVFPDASFPMVSNTPTSAQFDPEGHGYTWHWLERE